MSAIGTLLVSALATVGAVTVAKQIKRRLRTQKSVDPSESSSKTINLEKDTGSGVWRDNKS